MEPDVQLTIDALNVARQRNEDALKDVQNRIAAAREDLGRAEDAVVYGLAMNEQINALSATLFHQVGDLAKPTDPHALPTAPIPGWTPRLAEDFSTDVARGTAKAFFEKKGWAFYDSATIKDTSKRGTYDTSLAVFVQDGILNSRYGFKGTTTQVPYGAAMLPLGWAGVTYGRFAVRFRVDRVEGRKIAWLLWPANGRWEEGEIDFPEAGAGGPICGFNHKLGPMPNPQQNQMAVDTGVSTTDWHTAVIEWLPTRLTFLLDGKVVKETRDAAAIPKTPMRWVLQCETALDNNPIPTSSIGHAQVAWLTVHTPA